jgi:hypothetical protein
LGNRSRLHLQFACPPGDGVRPKRLGEQKVEAGPPATYLIIQVLVAIYTKMQASAALVQPREAGSKSTISRHLSRLVAGTSTGLGSNPG